MWRWEGREPPLVLLTSEKRRNLKSDQMDKGKERGPSVQEKKEHTMMPSRVVKVYSKIHSRRAFSHLKKGVRSLDEKQVLHRSVIDRHSAKADERGESRTFLQLMAESQCTPFVISHFFDCRLSFLFG